MPRIRERKHQEQALAVTPWMEKKASTEGVCHSTKSGSSPEQLMYSVVLADAQLATSSSAPNADMMRPSVGHLSRRDVDISLGAANTHGGWHVVRKRSCSSPSLVSTGFASTNQTHSTTATTADTDNNLFSTAACKRSRQSSKAALYQLHEAVQPLAGKSSSIHMPHDLLVEDHWDGNIVLERLKDTPRQQQEASSTLQLSQGLQGVAQLIILSCGTITGHFIAQNHSSCTSSNSKRCNDNRLSQQQQQLLQPPICFGLHGRQVLGIHSCYRDPEWALLQLSIIKYGVTDNERSGCCSKAGTVTPTAVAKQEDAAQPCSIGNRHHSSRTSSSDHAAEAVQAEGHKQRGNTVDAEDGGTANISCTVEQQHEVEHRQHADLKQKSVELQDAQQQQQLQQDCCFPPAAGAAAAATTRHPDFAAAMDPMTTTKAAASMSADETTSDNSSDGSSTPATEYACIQESIPSRNSGSIVSEATAWVQRTGGDLVTLSPADMDDEDTAAVILHDNLGLDPDFVHVEFKAHTLLAGADADKQLQQSWPQLVGQQDVVVNIGRMTISNLPAGWM